ncbi:thiamine phosphate synthase [Rhodoferax antarcticus]|uniref:thiamine phosphate synthase n=1 Tax=Rhodoferax antarcticus TaxID=81479 RepID=UPI0030B81375
MICWHQPSVTLDRNDRSRCRNHRSRSPEYAIGGIDLHNAADVLDAGAHGLAVVSALCSADDPRAAAQSFRALFAQPLPSDGCGCL